MSEKRTVRWIGDQTYLGTNKSGRGFRGRGCDSSAFASVIQLLQSTDGKAVMTQKQQRPLLCSHVSAVKTKARQRYHCPRERGPGCASTGFHRGKPGSHRQPQHRKNTSTDTASDQIGTSLGTTTLINSTASSRKTSWILTLTSCIPAMQWKPKQPWKNIAQSQRYEPTQPTL